jgi:hypothetical protein
MSYIRPKGRLAQLALRRQATKTDGLSYAGSVSGSAHFALAAIAAAAAFLAAMIGAGVLGAVGANVGGRLAADAAGEGHGYVHCFFPCGFGRLRQRWASLSTTANSCSFWLARSVMYWRSLSRLAEFSPSTPSSRSPTAGF